MEEKKSSIPVKEWINQYREQFLRYEAYCESNDWVYKDKEDLETEYDAQKTIVKIVLDRLKYFVSKFEPYIEYKYSQDFMELILAPIRLYLERCDKYISINDWLKIEDKEEQIEEVEFQSDVITDSNKIKDELQKLNLDEDVLILDLPIHSDKKIPFLMGSVVESRFPQIEDFKKSLSDYNEGEVITPSLTAYDLENSQELFKNIKNPPPYDPTKHYFEQPSYVTDFYKEELNKIVKGVTIGGVYIHGWLYWHINFFKTDIPMVMFEGTPMYDDTKERLIHTPFLRDNELFLAESYKEADDKNLGLFIFGTRRAGKTVIESSILTWRTTIVENSESIVIGGDEGDLSKLSRTLEIGFSNVHPAFKLTRNNNDWSTQIQFGLKDKAGERIPYSDIFIKNVNSGKKQSSLKTAGATPTAWIVDEAGKFNCKKMFKQAIPSFQNPRGWGVVPILTGTGGDADLSIDAQDMLTNPEANKILPMNWQRLEGFVPEKDLVTWKRKSFGIFVPAQMSFKEGLIKKDTNLADFYELDDKALKRVEVKITDWEQSLKVIKRERKLVSKKPSDLNDEKMGYPIDPMECFLNRIENPFPAVEAQLHKEDLERNGNSGRLVDVFRRDGTSNMGYSFSEKELAIFPFEGGNIDAPVLLFEDPPEDNIMDGTYVAGLDHYKHDKSSTDSLGSLYVFKRNVNLDEWSGRIVASYCSRPNSIDTFNKIAEIIIEGYGAECLQENADISFQQHLKKKHKDALLLANGEEFAKKFVNPTARQNNKYGLNPNTKNQQYLLNLVISYCHEEIVVGQDDEEEDIIVKGVTRINDIELLNEIINFNYTGNFDRIIAFGHALAWARYLDSMNIMPKVKKNREESTYKKQLRKQQAKYRSPYSTKHYSPYKR